MLRMDLEQGKSPSERTCRHQNARERQCFARCGIATHAPTHAIRAVLLRGELQVKALWRPAMTPLGGWAVIWDMQGGHWDVVAAKCGLLGLGSPFGGNAVVLDQMASS